MEATAAIYVQLLERLAQQRRFELLVHPVPPVLDATRAIVIPFEAVLRRHVVAAAARPALKGRLHYLDFIGEELFAHPSAPTSPVQGVGATGGESGRAVLVVGTCSPAACKQPAPLSVRRGVELAARSPPVSAPGSSPSSPPSALIGPHGKRMRVTSPCPLPSAPPPAGELLVRDGAGPGGARLRPELAFDGTHLAPAYVAAMDAALRRIAACLPACLNWGPV